MWKKLLSIFLSAVLFGGVLCSPAFAALHETSYIFRLTDPENTAVLTDKAEPLSAGTGLYRTASYALVRRLDALGALAAWDVDSEVCLDGVVEDLKSQKTTDYRAAMLGYSYPREKNITGKGVKVGVIDSGLWTGFAAKTKATILEGVNFLAEADSEERSNTEDDVGHGTFVTSILCGDDIGLAPEVTVLPLKCFSDKTTSAGYIIAAIEEAIAQECDVINLSLGTDHINVLMRETLQRAFAAGIIVVAAGGNLSGCSTGQDPLYYPAGYEGVIGVGSLDYRKTASDRAAQNSSIYVTAPGVGVKGISMTTGGLVTKTGTSYSAPVVTALAALALSADPTLTRERFADLLASTAEDLGTENRDNAYGFGLVNPALLLQTLLRDSESMVLTAWEDGNPGGAVGLSMWLSEESGRPFLACYARSGRLQKLICPASLCCYALENDPGRVTLFYLGEEYSPLSPVRTLCLFSLD